MVRIDLCPAVIVFLFIGADHSPLIAVLLYMTGKLYILFSYTLFQKRNRVLFLEAPGQTANKRVHQQQHPV